MSAVFLKVMTNENVQDTKTRSMFAKFVFLLALISDLTMSWLVFINSTPKTLLD